MNEGKNPLLSISMLVSNNRTDTIVKCMESLLPLRKAVPCELILVDTGCTDGGIELARPYADRVVQFAWCNDFSMARNAGLSLCGGEWFLYLDDDEWFEDVDDILHFFQSGEYKNYEAAWYVARNYSNFEGTAYSDAYVGRMYRNVQGLRFCGKIHEWLEPVPRKIAYLSSYVHHYGYVFRTKEEEEKHFLRNLKLEEEAVKEHPEDIRMCCQLVQEYFAAKRYIDAENLCKKTLKETKYGRENAFVQYLLTILPRLYVGAERETEARAELLRLEREEKLSGLAKLTVLLEKMYSSCRSGNAEAVLEEAYAYLTAAEDKKSYENEYPVMDFSKYISEKSIQVAVQNGCKAMLQLERFERAKFFFSKVDWSGDEEQTDWFVKALLLCYQKTGNKELLEKLLALGLHDEWEAKCVLSISMLVSNGRRDTIEKCMKSLLPLREAVSSELILVDTGCTDGGIELARPYADKVIEFTWCNDFAAARNAGLFECSGEWFLYLDDDEWFGDVSELISFFTGKEKDMYDMLWYYQRNYSDFEGTSYSDAYVSRVVKRTGATRFCGKIHEWLEPLPKKIKKINVFVHHYGYLFKTEEEYQKHIMRNLILEEEEVKKNPDDIRMCSQLIQEYQRAKRYEDAIALCESTLERTVLQKTNSFVQYILTALPKIYSEQGENEKALEEYARLEREETLLHQSRMQIYTECAHVLWDMGRYRDALEECRRYFKECKWILKEGDPDEFEVMYIAQYLSLENKRELVLVAARCMLRSNEFTYAKEVFAEVDWEGLGTEKEKKELFTGLLCCYVECNDGALLRDGIQRFLTKQENHLKVYAGLHSVCENKPELAVRLATDVELLGRRDGNFAYFHLLYTESIGATTLQDLEDYYTKSDRKYDAEVAGLFLDNKELLSYVKEQTPIEAYKEAVEKRLAEKKQEQFATEAMPASEEDVQSEILMLAAQLKANVRALLANGRTAEAKAILSELAMMLPVDEEVKELLYMSSGE